METKRVCPSCGKALAPDVPMGLCPECLIKAGFATGTEPGAEDAGKRFVPPPVSELAQLFPQLEILEFIGKGGMGAVYKARQPALDRFVALKILPPATASDPGFAERFNREARALARMSHPNIVGVHDFGKAGNLHYLIMEFVDGANLREVERAGRLDPKQALSIVPQICEALQFAHGEGIVHRDIKPENILLDKKGRVKITDFGIAKIIGLTPDKAALTGVRDVVGTPHYMAPEQIEKPQTVDHRADIYSLGVVFYEMLTGELPLGRFSAPSAKVQVDVRLDEVVLRALEKEPSLRYQQANALKTEVETIATNPGKSPAQAASSKISSTTRIPWQIWVVVVMLSLEGLGNLMSIPRNPEAAFWLVMKGIFITGLLLRWRPVWFIFSVISIFHIIAFLPHQPVVSLLNLILLALVVSTYRFYFPTNDEAPGPNERLARNLLKIWAWIVGILWLPVVGLAVFFIIWFVNERGNWNPSPQEAVIVPMTWVASLLMPIAAWLMWRAAKSLSLPSSQRKLVSPHLLIAGAAVLIMGAGFAFYLTTIANKGFSSPPSSLAEVYSGRANKNLAFGPVMERIVNGDPITSDQPDVGDFLIDLDTGSVLTPPRTTDADLNWVIANGVDARGVMSADMRGLVATEGTVFIPVDEMAWLTLTPSRVSDLLSAITSAGSGKVSRISAERVPVALAFKTREGNMGLLQITGFTENPRSINLRYKLIESTIEDLATNQNWEGAKLVNRPPQPGRAYLFAIFLVLVFIGGIATLVVLLWKGRISAGRAILLMLLVLIAAPLLLGAFWIITYNLARQPTNVATYPSASRPEVPVSAHMTFNNHSLFVAHDNANIHYTLYYKGDFSSSGGTQRNVRSVTWYENHSIRLKNGVTFGFQRDAVSPDFLRINGTEYDLRKGSLLKLLDNGVVEQFPTSIPRALANNLEQVGAFIAVYEATLFIQYDFAPIAGYVLNDPDDDLKSSFVDLDSGRVVDCPVEWPAHGMTNANQFEAGMRIGLTLGMGDKLATAVRGKGIDIQSDASGNSLTAWDSAVIRIANNQFETMTAEGILNRFTSIQPTNGTVTLHAESLPATWLIKTREDGMGILQITDFSDNPRAARILYRPVRTSSKKSRNR